MSVQRHLAAGLAAFTIALAAGSAHAEMKNQWVDYSHGNTKLKGYMAYDDSVAGKRPAVLVLHARDGMTDATLRKTQVWAKLGYVAFASDIYGFGEGLLLQSCREDQGQSVI